MIVLFAFAIVAALIAVAYFAGSSVRQPTPPAQEGDYGAPLNPGNPLSPFWMSSSDSSSDDPHRHGSSPAPHASDPEPHACGDDAHHRSSHCDVPTDTGSFDAGSHHSH